MKLLVYSLLGYMVLVAGVVIAEGFKVSPLSEPLLVLLILGVGVFQCFVWFKVIKNNY